MDNCIFCKIIDGSIPSTKVYEDDLCLAFKDINPMAPVHIVVIPKKHGANLSEFKEEDIALLGHIQLCLGKIAKEQGIFESGYRIVSNCGKDAGQSVNHLHYHILGGKQLPLELC